MITIENRNAILIELYRHSEPWKRSTTHEIEQKLGVKDFHIRRVRRNYADSVTEVQEMRKRHSMEIEAMGAETNALKSELMNLKIKVALGIAHPCPEIKIVTPTTQTRVIFDGEVVGRGECSDGPLSLALASETVDKLPKRSQEEKWDFEQKCNELNFHHSYFVCARLDEARENAQSA